MKKKLCSVFLLLLMLTACQQDTDSVVISTMPSATQPAVAGTMQETVPVTEAETEADTVPSLETTKAWTNYHDIKKENIPQTKQINITQDTSIQTIEVMVGGIEQRFYASQAFSQESMPVLSAMWEKFTGETLDERNLLCTLDEKTMSFPSVPEEEYADILSVSYESGKAVMTYDTGTGSVTLDKRTASVKEPVSVYTQTRSLYNYPQEIEYDPETNTYTAHALPDLSHAYAEDAVILKGEEVKISDILHTVLSYLYTLKEVGSNQAEWDSVFFTPDYEIDDESLRIETYPNGNQGIYLSFSFSSRDIPVIFDNGTADGRTKQIKGTRLEIGMFSKDEIGYIQTNYFIRKPDEIQLTDPRSHMEGTTLIDIDTAFSLADEKLTEIRNLELAQLQYATEEIHDSRGTFQGRVLTPVWHFVFAPTESEQRKGYAHKIIDIDAITSEIFSWYSEELEQSGEKNWISNIQDS